MGRLNNKVAIITGGARGMGAATVRLFVAEGAKVLIADVLDADGAALAKELGANAAFIHHDVTDEASWGAALAKATSAFGKVDVLVNNAGVLLFKSLASTEKAEFEKVLGVNLIGAFLGMRIVGGHMVENGRGSIVNISSVDGMKAANANGENFYYILYHQEPGVAEKEYDADPRGLLSRLYTSKDTPTEPPAVTDPKRSAGGWIPRLGKPKELPHWLTQQDLDYFVSQFQQAGFRGGVNYYRNFDRNWEITPELAGARINVPVGFIAGEDDIVIRGAKADALRTQMTRVAEDLRAVTLVPGAGHWVQQEQAEAVNRLLLGFLQAA